MGTGVDVDSVGMREDVDEPFGWTTIVSRVSFAGVAGRRLDIPGLEPTGKCQWLGKKGKFQLGDITRGGGKACE